VTQPSNLKVKRLDELDLLPAVEGTQSWLYAVQDNHDYKVDLAGLTDAIVDVAAEDAAVLVKDELAGSDGASLIGYGGSTVEAQLDNIIPLATNALQPGDPDTELNFLQNGTDAVVRTTRDKLRESVSVRDFGAVGDGVTVDNQFIINAIAQRPSGSAIRFPAGDWLIDARIDITLTSPLTIELDAGARLLGTSTSSGPMLTIRGGTGRYPLVVRGGQIDNGDRIFVLAEQSGTALDLIDIDDYLIEGVVFGRKSRDYVDNFGDSGITATRCQRGTVVGCTFYGQPDLGIYITGGASTGASDDYGDLLVTGNRFVRCSVGISAKRQFPRLVVVGNTFDECGNGVTMFEAGGIPPGRCFVIANNVFRRTVTRAIRIHGPGVGTISGNVIEDFGFNRSLVSVSAIGILLSGASDCTITGNVIKFTDWTSDSNHTAISLPQTTIDGITYTPARNNITGNSIHAVYRALQESSAGINYYTANSIIGSTTTVTGMNAASIIEFYDLSGRRVFVGSTEQARQSGTAHFIRNLRFFESATAAASAPAFSATHYIPINANGTTYYLPVSNAVW
jgi:hypothetical protein